MTEFQMCQAALRRPSNYNRLSPDDQWGIDKRLGILDWNGINLKVAEEMLATDTADDQLQARFRMSRDELEAVVRGFKELQG